MDEMFPPALTVGSRLWTIAGYPNHGPMEGPKVDISPNMGGTISGISRPYSTIDSLLFSVDWDNGQRSKHYSKGLFCIGRFRTLSEFEAAIKFTTPVEVTLGPQGGFRKAKLSVEYDGKHYDVELSDRSHWLGCFEPLATTQGVEVRTVKLPPKARKKQ